MPEGRRRTLRGRVALWCTISAAVSLIVFACVTYVVVLLQERDEARTGIQPTPQHEARTRALVALAAAAPIGLTLAVVGSRWLARRALSPIDDVVRTAAGMTAEQLDRRLAVPRTDDELRALVISLNDLFARLETGFAALGSYAADASHELRTPLAVIATELEVALRRPRAAAEWEASAKTALDEVRRLTRLVESLLALARAQGAPPPSVDCDLREIVDDAVAASSARAEAAGVALAVKDDDPARAPIPRRGDPVALAAALGNLVENAIRYTPRGGAVQIAVDRAAGGGARAAVHVDDSGPGVPEGERDAIFSPFRRGAAARAADANGLGLGLSIARRIVDRHGGTLRVGDSPAGGARFTIEI